MTQALTITASGTSDLAIGKEIVVNVDWSRVPADYLAHCLTKVTRDKLQDSHASIAAKDDASGKLSRAKAMKVLDSIYSGEFRLRGDGKTAEPVDPVSRMAIKVAQEQLEAAGVKRPGPKEKDALSKYLAAVAKHAQAESVRAIATERLAKAKELATGLDLAALGLVAK